MIKLVEARRLSSGHLYGRSSINSISLISSPKLGPMVGSAEFVNISTNKYL